MPTTGNNPVTIASDVPPLNTNVWAEAARRKLPSIAHCLVPVANAHATHLSNQATTPITHSPSPAKTEDQIIEAFNTLYSHGVICTVLQATGIASFPDLFVIKNPQVLRRFQVLVGMEEELNKNDNGGNDPSSGNNDGENNNDNSDDDPSSGNNDGNNNGSPSGGDDPNPTSPSNENNKGGDGEDSSGDDDHDNGHNPHVARVSHKTAPCS